MRLYEEKQAAASLHALFPLSHACLSRRVLTPRFLHDDGGGGSYYSDYYDCLISFARMTLNMICSHEIE